MKTAFDAFLNFFKDHWKLMLEALLVLLGGPLGAIVAAFLQWHKQILAGLEAALSAIKAAWTAAWNAIKAAGEAVWDALKTAAEAVWNAIKSALSTAMNAIKTVWSDGWNAVKAAGQAIWNGITAAARALISVFTGIGKDIIMGLVHGIEGAAGAVYAAIKKVANTVKNFFTSIIPHGSDSPLFIEYGAGMMTGLTTGINQNAMKPVGAIGAAASSIVSTANSVVNNLSINYGGSPAQPLQDIHLLQALAVRGT